jgi:hypothetical protein
MIIFFDTSPPELTISEPPDQSDYYGDENQVKIMGLTEEGARVTVNGRLVVMNQDGSFEFTFSLSEGTNPIKIVATDQAGNQAEKEITINYSP